MQLTMRIKLGCKLSFLPCRVLVELAEQINSSLLVDMFLILFDLLLVVCVVFLFNKVTHG